jgi:type VI protein secretion system component Hcp
VSSVLQALDAGESLVDSFDYTISDAKGNTDTATASVTVNGRSETGGGSASNQLLAQVAPQVELQYYVRFEGNGIDNDWLRLEDFELGLSNGAGAGSKVGGAGAGKVSADAVQLVLGTSSTLVQLSGALLKGQLIEEVEIEAYAPDQFGQMALVDEYRFDNVLLSGLATTGTPTSTTESLSFNYTKISYAHEQDGSEASAGYDLGKAKADGGGGGSADALNGSPPAGLTTDADLQYYVTYEGADGWLELEGFSMALANSGSAGGIKDGGIRAAGKSSLDEVRLELGSSKQLVDLFASLTKGEHLEYLQVEAYHKGDTGVPELVDEYHFEDVVVRSLASSGANQNEVGIVAAKFGHGHIEPGEFGGGNAETAWSFVDNKAWNGPSPDADLF